MVPVLKDGKYRRENNSLIVRWNTKDAPLFGLRKFLEDFPEL